MARYLAAALASLVLLGYASSPVRAPASTRRRGAAGSSRSRRRATGSKPL